MEIRLSDNPEVAAINAPFLDDLNAEVDRLNRISICLDIGCGNSTIHPKFLGIDAYVDGPNIIKANMWNLPFEDDTVSIITSFHALEHLSKFQVPEVLWEFTRVLKPGGKLYLIVPNLYWAMQKFLENPSVEWEMDLIFGNQRHEGEFHKTAFTPEIIKMYFDATDRLELINVYDILGWSQMGYGVIGKKVIK